jgi:hypothetical protein
MKHRRSSLADSDLDDIWYYVACQSGSMDVADRLISSITDPTVWQKVSNLRFGMGR